MLGEQSAPGPAGVAISRENSQEGYLCRLGSDGVVDVVSQVQRPGRAATLQDFHESFCVRFRSPDVLNSDDGTERTRGPAAVKRVVDLGSNAPGKEREFGAARQASQAGSRKKPLFARHVSLPVLSPVKLHELALHFVVFEFAAERSHPCGGELPVVVEARPVFPAMQLGSESPACS